MFADAVKQKCIMSVQKTELNVKVNKNIFKDILILNSKFK